MKHEITTELRNTVIQVIANAVIKASFAEISNLIQMLKGLPEIKEVRPESKPAMTASDSPADGVVRNPVPCSKPLVNSKQVQTPAIPPRPEKK